MALSAKTGYIAPANKYVAVELLTSMRTFKMSCVGNTYEQRRFHNCKMFYKKKGRICYTTGAWLRIKHWTIWRPQLVVSELRAMKTETAEMTGLQCVTIAPNSVRNVHTRHVRTTQGRYWDLSRRCWWPTCSGQRTALESSAAQPPQCFSHSCRHLPPTACPPSTSSSFRPENHNKTVMDWMCDII